MCQRYLPSFCETSLEDERVGVDGYVLKPKIKRRRIIGSGQNNVPLENVPTNAPAIPDPLPVRGLNSTHERLICHEITHSFFAPTLADEHAGGGGHVSHSKRNRFTISAHEQYRTTTSRSKLTPKIKKKETPSY